MVEPRVPEEPAVTRATSRDDDGDADGTTGRRGRRRAPGVATPQRPAISWFRAQLSTLVDLSSAALTAASNAGFESRATLGGTFGRPRRAGVETSGEKSPFDR